MAEPAKIVTGIGNAELHRILVRGYDLNKELVGKITFTDMTSLILRGRLPTPNEAKMLVGALPADAENPDLDAIAASIIDDYSKRKQRMPGSGHRTHAEGDPRVDTLLGIAKETGVYGKYCELI